MDEKYLVVNESDATFKFCSNKEEAARVALDAVGYEGEEAIIYLVKPIGTAYIPDLPVVIDWMED